MTPLEQTIYLATTDLDFRHALQAGPQTAAVAHGLTLDDEELDVLYALRPLLDLSPDELVRAILDGGSTATMVRRALSLSKG